MEPEIPKTKKPKKKLIERVKNIPKTIVLIFQNAIFFIKFLILLFLVFLKHVLNNTPKKKVNKPKRSFVKFDFIKNGYNKFYTKVLGFVDTKAPNEVKSSDLIMLAMNNLFTRGNRTYVTIGGMAIGFGAVILLLSTGYGFEKLVISQVASLSEMKQVDVSVPQSSPLTFNEETLTSLQDITNVSKVIPIITSVSKVTYNNAVSDVIVYGVNSDYIIETGLSTIKGEVFEDSRSQIESNSLEKEEEGVVAGTSSVLINKTSVGEEIYKIKYSINPLVWKPVYAKPDITSTIIGYTKRNVGKQDSIEVWGKKYRGAGGESAIDIEGTEYSTWISDSFSLWEKKTCKMVDPDCIDERYLVLRDANSQEIRNGYITEEDTVKERYEISQGSSLKVYSGKIIDTVPFRFKQNDFTDLFFGTQADSLVVPVKNLKENTEYKGQLIYGDFYENSDGYYVKSNTGKNFGYWIKADLQLWGEQDCFNVCSQYTTEKVEDTDILQGMSIYIKASDVILSENINIELFSDVLGESTTAEDSSFVDLETLKTTDDSIDWVSISSEIGGVNQIETDIKTLPSDAQKVVLVNTSMLNLLGLEVNEAVGQEFEAKLIFDSNLFDKTNYIVESEETLMTIVGVVSDSKSPTFYMPFSDLQVEGLNNASSVKIVLENTESVSNVRGSIEALGLQTSSVVDTVDSISNLFGSVRIGLLVLGLIALGVASLGMFNTLTVSLLEKTREVGLLKTMGLKSTEVKILFLAESIIMSVLGGVTGLILGFLVGKLLSLLITILAITQGQGAIDLTYIPAALAITLVVLSAIVGVGTGWYPAERAKTISALNALRYE